MRLYVPLMLRRSNQVIPEAITVHSSRCKDGLNSPLAGWFVEVPPSVVNVAFSVDSLLAHSGLCWVAAFSEEKQNSFSFIIFFILPTSELRDTCIRGYIPTTVL